MEKRSTIFTILTVVIAVLLLIIVVFSFKYNNVKYQNVELKKRLSYFAYTSNILIGKSNKLTYDDIGEIPIPFNISS